MFQKLFILLLSFTLSIHALTTPHAVRSIHHRAIAAHVPLQNIGHPTSTPRRRQSSKRCKPRPVSSSIAVVLPSSSSSSSRAPETTTRAQEPVPTTTTRAQEPTTTVRTTTRPQEAPPATTTRAQSNPNLPSFLIGTQSGQGTFYDTGLGACGITNSDTDYIAAVSHLLFDNYPGYTGGNPNKNPICGKKVKATYRGKSVTVAITDRCEGCATTDLDFSPSAFNQIADFAIGRISEMTWEWL